jgi:hypothetical protein
MTTTRTDYSSLAWEKRVEELEAEGVTTSDAQSIADVEWGELAPWGWDAESGVDQITTERGKK